MCRARIHAARQSAGNGVILGKSGMGKAGVLNEFASPREAQEILGDGELLKAAALAFNPSPDYTPQKIYAMVVNNNTQAARQIVYGVPANQLKMRLSEGQDAGTKKVIFIFKGDDNTKETIDNLLGSQ